MREDLTEIKVTWKKKSSKAGWLIEETKEEFLFSSSKLKRIPTDLRSGNLVERFETLLDNNEAFTDYWLQTCGGNSLSNRNLKHFILQFTDEAWSIPWELLIERLRRENRPNVILSRGLPGSAVPHAPKFFDEPLRILIIQGADRDLNGRVLDLDKEAGQVMNCWKKLNFELRECVAQPKIEKATTENLPGLLKTHRPHMLWFSGHGRSRPFSGLLLADPGWIDAKTFVSLIERSGHKPFYYVFWSCSIAKKTKTSQGTDRQQNFPEMYRELQKVNALAMLAMQAPIRDAAAIRMTRLFFEELAVGRPLERALALARLGLMTEAINDPSVKKGEIHRMDWASPVVWNNGFVVDEWKWNSEKQPGARLQVFADKAFHSTSSLPRPEILYDEPRHYEREKVKFWLNQNKTWIYRESGGAEKELYLKRTLQLIQAISGKYILYVSFGDPSALEIELRDWATQIIENVISIYIPDFIREVLKRIETAPTTNWSALCRLPGLYLAIENPPPFSGTQSEPKWFWAPLIEDDHQIYVTVISHLEIQPEFKKFWKIDKMPPTGEKQLKHEEYRDILQKSPQLIKALAVLDMPIDKYLIDEFSLLTCEWEEIESQFIETSAGPLICDSFRHFVMQEMSPEQRRQSHIDCFRLLNHPDIFLTDIIREQRLRHLLGAGEEYENVLQVETEILLERYRNTNRPYAAKRIYETIGHRLAKNAKPVAMIIIAWAHAQLGEMQMAKLWLNWAHPADPIAVAWKHGLMAEIYKSLAGTYTKDDTLNQIQEAIDVLEEHLKKIDTLHSNTAFARGKLRAYQQDKARILQYLFYEHHQAAQEYERLIEEWRTQSDAQYDLAVIYRNYAECLRNQSTAPKDKKWNEAKKYLRDAKTMAREKYKYTELWPGILLEEAKNYKIENNPVQSKKVLTDCIHEAVANHHDMVAAIAENKLFWEFESFRFDRWTEIEQKLAAYPYHGWAVRALINGRIRCAQYYWKNKELLEDAMEQLLSNHQLLKRNPAFDGRSDKRRTAITFAGLQIISTYLDKRFKASYWKEFLELDWARKWLEENNKHSYETIWKEVI